MKKQLSTLTIAIMFAFGASAALSAHEETFKGTVIEVTDRKINVLVIDDKSKKETPMVFELTTNTKVFRGDKQIKWAEAKIQKEERIAVTINHDASAHKATIVRLAAR